MHTGENVSGMPGPSEPSVLLPSDFNFFSGFGVDDVDAIDIDGRFVSDYEYAVTDREKLSSRGKAKTEPQPHP